MNTWGLVDLHRDPYGTPLLDAGSAAAAYYGLGYAQAQDDLTGLLRQYLLVRGELATVDGPAAAERDLNQFRWQVLAEARAGYAALPAAVQQYYQAFVAGVGAWMAEHPELVPGWAPPLEPALPIGVNRTVMLYWTVTDAVTDLRAAGVEPPGVTSELDDALALPGSNAWVLRPWRTATGETVVLSDPHIPFGGTFALHEATIRTPELHYTGFAFLGAAIAPLAHTRHCAWGLTTGGPRASDAYRIEVAADGRYRVDDEWRELRRTTVTVGGEPVEIEHVEHNGVRAPVVARDDGAVYVICNLYGGLAGQTEANMLAALRATDVAGVYAAFAAGTFPPQNVLAADTTGDCFYLRTGRVPRRPDGVGRGVLDGNTAATAWTGVLPAAELVQVANPESGWLQNCNTAPDTVTPDAALAPQKWAADAFNDVPGRLTCRGERSVELLSRAYAVDVATVTGWAVEDRWPDTPRWQAALTAAATSAPALVRGWSAPRHRFLRLLLAFDGDATPDSTAATAWVGWRTAVAGAEVPATALRELAARIEAAEPMTSGDAVLLLGAVERAADGYTGLPYGEAFPFAPGIPGRGGAFAVRPPAPGDVAADLQVSLRATYFGPDGAVAGGPALRVVALGGPDGMRSWSLLLTGRPDRQAERYAEARLKECFFEPGSATSERTL